MPEGTIFQGVTSPSQNNPAPSPQVLVVNPKQNNGDFKNGGNVSSRFSPKRLIKIGAILFLILTILFVVLAFVLPRLKPQEKNVTLVYWGFKEDSSVIDPVISEFEKENPNINVEYSKQDAADYREKLSTRISNGNGPDIFKFHNTWFPMIRDDLLPFPQETIDKKQFTDNFYNVAKTDLIKNGAIYGIPLETDTLALYVNTSLFEQAGKEQSATISVPKTWQEFIDASSKLTKRDETGKIATAGAAIGTYDNVNHASDIISLLFAQNGVDINNISEFPEKISDALRFYTTFSLTENAVWDTTLDPSLNAFSEGKLAMYFGYYWDFFDIKSKNPNLSFKIYPVPQLLNDNKVNIASYWADGVSSKSKNQKEALLFMKFLAKEETQRKIFQEQTKARGLGQPYGNKNLAGELKNTDSFVFADQANSAVSSPFVGGTFDNGLNDDLNNILKEIVREINNSANTESASSSLIDGYLETLSKYVPQPTK